MSTRVCVFPDLRLYDSITGTTTCSQLSFGQALRTLVVLVWPSSWARVGPRCLRRLMATGLSGLAHRQCLSMAEMPTQLRAWKGGRTLLYNGSASAKVCVANGSDGARREAADTNRAWCWRGGTRDAILPVCAWPCPCNVRAGAYSYMGAFASTSRLSTKLFRARRSRSVRSCAVTAAARVFVTHPIPTLGLGRCRRVYVCFPT